MRVACALSSLRTDWVVAERSTTVALATRSQGRDHGQVRERGHDAARPHVEGKPSSAWPSRCCEARSAR